MITNVFAPPLDDRADDATPIIGSATPTMLIFQNPTSGDRVTLRLLLPEAIDGEKTSALLPAEIRSADALGREVFGKNTILNPATVSNWI